MCTVGLGSTTHDPSFTTVLGKDPASVGSVCASWGGPSDLSWISSSSGRILID